MKMQISRSTQRVQALRAPCIQFCAHRKAVYERHKVQCVSPALHRWLFPAHGENRPARRGRQSVQVIAATETSGFSGDALATFSREATERDRIRQSGVGIQPKHKALHLLCACPGVLLPE